LDECDRRQRIVMNFRAVRACRMGRTKWLPQMDCGWQNLERAAGSRSEYLKPLPSNADCIERAVPPQTSGMRDVLSLSAIISLQPTSGDLR